MSFTVATAITRLTGSGVNAFPATFSAANQLQRINEVLERFYEFGTWRGLHDTLSPLDGNQITTTGGIITLSSAYQRLDKLAVPSMAMEVPIRDMVWAFSTGGPGNQDWTLYGTMVAVDQGDVAGVRKYRVTGGTATLDAMQFSGLARKRFTWITDTSTVVPIDSFQGLKLGVQAMHWEDEGDEQKYAELFGKAMQVLNGNLAEFQPETKQVVIQRAFGLLPRSFVH